MTMLAEKKWISCEERNPEKYGKYRVICKQKGVRTEAEYLWNGGYWVTPGGSPSKAVLAWQETIWTENGEDAAAGAEITDQAKAMIMLPMYEARIRLYKEQAVTGYIGIGRTLNEAKAAGVVPHGEWESWVEETTGLSIRQAQRCMKAASEIREGSFLGQIDMSKAMLLLSSGLDEEQREELGRKAAEEGATVKELKEEIRQTKIKLVQESGTAAEIRNALKKAEAERNQIEQQMRATEQAYKERLDEVRESGYQRGNIDGRAEAMEQVRKEADEQISGIREDMQRKIDQANRRADDQNAAARSMMMERDALRNELNKQTQYAEELAKLLDDKEDEYQRMLKQADEEAREDEREKMATAVPADFAKDREILMAAAEEAEKRAAEAEAELEALRAGAAGRPAPAWKTIADATDRFLDECEMLPIQYVPGILQGENKVRKALERMELWIRVVHEVIDGAVQAEGAVE